MSKETYTIKVVTRTQDNGDGGYTTYAYNSEEEMLKDHPAIENAIEEEMNEEDLRALTTEILSENDPYENGYIGSDSIKVEIVDGVAKLAKPLSFHAGQ